ncbi:hypothetical protein A3H03_02805 [Candidatus Kuenenbacteria bacterium RIFCSPLOWO2_12_FULL_42_13]|uniref:Peptidase S49 domain-containing protein n=3 Tax=Candidatus Kueneniibacteriota TaxID=1752740 RepID=A0A1F6G188_9BACT|nr:MAG: hypothetical protein A3H03_02805 [Candidatus Kuenenbacteria bacterium RIFCSPLOWO2_12_FULL_42_13]
MDMQKLRVLFGPKVKKVFKIIGIAIVVFIIIAFCFGVYFLFFSSDDTGEEMDVAEQGVEENCNVSGISLHGDLWTYISPADYDTDGNLLYDESASEDLVYNIEQAEKDEQIKAIILEIDSYGGGPTAGEEVANALKNAEKPTVALIREGGVSAAYWAASGADIIFASQNSDVGSIGVTMSYLDNTAQNQKEGLAYNQLSSGKFKDTGDPNKTLSVEEKALLMRDVNIIHQNFMEAVAENRNLDINKVKAMADGSSMLGEMALQNGLIDKIGGESEVKEYLKEKIGDEVEICW